MTRASVRNYLITLCIFLVGCGNALTVGGESSNPAVNYSCPTGTNVMSVTVNGSLCNAGTMYINMPCVAVTICYPGSPTNCQTINNILLDTGSFGLRIFSSLVSISLPQSNGDMVECAQFGSGRTWGPIVNADVYLAGEPKASVPIQLINSNYESGETSLCAGADVGPSTAGYNGILGVGLNNQDCGTACTGATPEPTYYACNGSVCSKTTSMACTTAYGANGCGSAMPVANQVSNPVPNFSSGPDTNGEVMFLPALNNGGNVAASGCVIFGVNTATGNNIPPAGVNVYQSTGGSNPGQSNAEFTVNTTSPASTSNPGSFIDSGSNAIYTPSSLGFPNCSGWYCPSNLTTVSFTIGGIGSSFLVTNANALFQTANFAYNDLSGNISSGTVDLGINYFFGRPIWVGVEKQSATILGTPYINGAGNTYGYWAY